MVLLSGIIILVTNPNFTYPLCCAVTVFFVEAHMHVYANRDSLVANEDIPRISDGTRAR